MQATFTPSGGGLVYLGDDWNLGGSGKMPLVIERLGGQSVEQVERPAFAANVARYPRGNVGGDCIITPGQSFATRDAGATYFKTVYGYLNQQGVMQLTFDSATLTMANAILRAVEKMEISGSWWRIRYSFGITTIT